MLAQKYATLWVVLACPVLIGAANFHNQLHANIIDATSITKHAVQMGYDYITQNDAHRAGLKRMTILSNTAVWLYNRDGAYHPEVGMSPTQKEEYDLYACMRDPNASDAAFRYYIYWMDPGAPCFDDASCNAGPSMLNFFTNYQSQTAINAAIEYFTNSLDWSNIDAGFVDSVERAPHSTFLVDPPYIFGTRYAGPELATCENPGPKDFSLSEGVTRYRQALRDLFRDRGLLVSANPYEISSYTQEVHATTAFDHYYNEKGSNQDASMFGIVPAEIVSLEVPYPGKSYDQDFGITLGVAGLAGKQGSWFGSYGESHTWVVDLRGFPVPGMNAIQLLRAMPNWDNLLNATNRSWNGSIYASSNSYADSNIVYSRHPKTGKLFTVFRSAAAVLPLRVSETVVSVRCVDDIFIEREDCAGHFAVNGSEVRLTESGQLNEGYIVEVR